MESYYAILEIHESATVEEIRDAYRLLLQIWHPDRFHHSPKLLSKAEQKTGTLNVAFETLSNPASKQRYDEWLRANRGWGPPVVGTVTCPSCQTTFRSNPDAHHPGPYRPAEKNAKSSNHSNHTAGALRQENVRMAIVAIAVLFVVVIIFAFTKKSKTIVSYKPAQTEETHSKNDLEASKEKSQRPATVGEGVSDKPIQPNGKETGPRTGPKAETQLDRLELMQRQLAQSSGRGPAASSDIVSAVDLQQLETLAAQGNAWAQAQLGQLYASGRRGVPQDYATAQGWYEKAAVQGNAWAQNQLGQLYADGRVVQQDYKKAREWWEQAAAQGLTQAQYNLGQLYANGRGVMQDYKAAREWYEKAATQGNAWAQAQLGQLYANGWGVPRDNSRAREWYEKAAAKGNTWAQAQLALL
jgi:TPR repeat protein